MDDQTIDRIARAVAGALAAPADAADATVHKAHKAGPEPLRVLVRFDKAQPALKHGVIFGVASTTRRDREGDEIDADELESMAYRFMAKANKRATDTHGPDIAGDFVASWVDAEQGHSRWRIGFRPHDRAIAEACARGAYVGFSVGGTATREEV